MQTAHHPATTVVSHSDHSSNQPQTVCSYSCLDQAPFSLCSHALNHTAMSLGLPPKTIQLSSGETTVLDQLATRHLSLNNARSSAAATGDVLKVLNAVRQQRGERILKKSEIRAVLPLRKQLLEIAKEPFDDLPEGYSAYVTTVTREHPDEVPVARPGVLEHYTRQVRFASFSVMLSKLQEAATALPRYEPRLRPIIVEATRRQNRPGPAFLYYDGCCISGTPASRARNDAGSSDRGRLFCALLDLWRIEEVHVYKINVEDVVVDRFEYRAQRKLQNVEHAIISARFPLCMNSAPGGFVHDFRLDRYTPSPLPAFHREAVPAAMAQLIKRHYEGMHQAYRNQGDPAKRVHPEALAQHADAATPRFLLKGRVPLIAVAKDVTEEDFYHRHKELGYRQRLAGPGPQATNSALLYQNGIDPLSCTTEVKLLALPPITDLFTVIAHH